MTGLARAPFAILLLSVSGASWAQDCAVTTAPGTHDVTCEGMPVYVHVPASCPASGCGLILEIHGDGGTGELQDAHLKLADLGEEAGYVLVAPTGGGFPPRDEALVAITRRFAEALNVDRSKIHATGFSRGGYAVWRIACDHADLFASIAPAAAGVARPGETSCFSEGPEPSRPIPILQLIGLNDQNVPARTQVAMRDLLVERWQLMGPQRIAADDNYAHTRWSRPDGYVLEVFEHRYATPRGGGHCVPGSTAYDAPRYAYGCAPPNAFNWGEEVIRFFQAYPMSTN